MISSAAHLPSDAGVDRDNPWPGLVAFREQDGGFFHGRLAETDELLRVVRRQTLTVLYGQSGLGKSSLLAAGLTPRLRQHDFLPVPLRLIHAAGAPPLSQQINRAISEAAEAAGIDAPTSRAEECPWEFLHHRDGEFWGPQNELLTPVLMLDQFEELFTLGRETPTLRAAGEAFAAALADLADNRAPDSLRQAIERGETRPADWDLNRVGCKIVVALREDFIPDFDTLRPLRLASPFGRMRLLRMTGLQAMEVILGAGGHLADPPVAREMVSFVAGAESAQEDGICPACPTPAVDADLADLQIDPALLSLFCRALNNERRSRGETRISSKLVAGSRGAVIANFYEDCVRDQSPLVRRFIEDRLLTAGGRRELVSLDTALTTDAIPRSTVDTLIDRRLLRLEEHFGVPRLELTHDVLAPAVKSSRDARQEQESVAEAERAQREAVEETRRSRSRRIWLGVAVAANIIIVLLSVLTLLAFHEWRTAVRLRMTAQQSEAYARQEKAKAEQQAKIAEERRGEAQRLEAQVETNLHLAQEQAALAERSRGEAVANLARALQSERESQQERTIAEQQARIAEERHLEAEQSKRKAEDEDRRAKAQAEIAAAQRQLAIGKVQEARNTLEQVQPALEALTKNGNPEALKDLSVLYNDLGDVRLKLGDAAGAKLLYLKWLNINTGLSVGDQEKKRAQSNGFDKFGNVAVLMGDTNNAKHWYTESLDTRKALVEVDPGDVQAKRNLVASYNNLGDLARKMGDAAGAINSYESGRKICYKMVSDRPDDPQAKRDLSRSYNRLGDVTLQTDSSRAKNFYDEGRKINEALAKADPGNEQAQRELSISYDRLGDVAFNLQSVVEAREWYTKDLSIAENLARADPENVQAQTDVVVSLYKLGATAETGMHPNPMEAAKQFEDALAILIKLKDAGKLKESAWIDILKDRSTRARAAAGQPRTRPAK